MLFLCLLIKQIDSINACRREEMGKAKRIAKRFEKTCRMSKRGKACKPLRGPDGWVKPEDAVRWTVDQRVRDAMGFEEIRLRSHRKMTKLIDSLMPTIGDPCKCIVLINSQVISKTDPKVFAEHFENLSRDVNRNEAIEFFIGLDLSVDFSGTTLRCHIGSPIWELTKKCIGLGLINRTDKQSQQTAPSVAQLEIQSVT